MKALSIKQPWASLIANGIKDIENRTWKTKFRGRIYIHASAKWDERSNGNNPDDIFTWEQRIAIPDFVKSKFMDYGVIVKDDETPLSAIIGEVDIVDCVFNHSSIWAESNVCVEKPLEKDYLYHDGKVNHVDYSAEYSKWKHQNGKPIYNWVLANPVLYEKPILNVKGKLSFWEPDEDTLDVIFHSRQYDAEKKLGWI